MFDFEVFVMHEFDEEEGLQIQLEQKRRDDERPETHNDCINVVSHPKGWLAFNTLNLLVMSQKMTQI